MMRYNENTTKLNSGKSIVTYLLINDQGMEVEVISLGATLTKVVVPDKEGILENVVLEWQDINTYEKNPGYIGATIGRVAGRIHQAKATLNNQLYTFTRNENENTLHGGANGLHSKIWVGEVQTTENEVRLQLSCESKDGEEGFPGNVKVKVTYLLNNENELVIKYEGTTDKLTLMNLTNHAYFNLSGNGKRSILQHRVWIDSDKIFELDNESIPTGAFLDLDNEKAFDFREPKLIEKDINTNSQQIKYGKGYDHLWLLNEMNKKVIELYDEPSGRCMEITTTEPCVVMYTMNNFLEEKLNTAKQETRYGVCFETQKCAIGYNEVFKEPCLLEPNVPYQSETKYKFIVCK